MRAKLYECRNCFQWVTTPNHVCWAADPKTRRPKPSEAMTSHEERAREWLENDGGSDSAARRNALAAEFAAVEAEAKKDTLALLERAVRDAADCCPDYPQMSDSRVADIAKRVWEGR